MTKPIGVLLMAYGTPATEADVEAYYTHIRRGRPPSTDALADLLARYAAIGGLSPLRERTVALTNAVARSLGSGYQVGFGMKHAEPFIEDAVADLVARDCERIVALVLAPHFSPSSVGDYLQRAEAAATAAELLPISDWHLEPPLIALLGARVHAGRANLPAGSEVVFTAHSLPARILELDDPYPDQVAATAAAVAARAGLDCWSTGWQSAGRTEDTWLGPDILDIIDDRAAAGRPGLLVAPIGFTADHLEILYDLDIAAAARAEQCGIRFGRTASLNDDPAFVELLTDLVRRRAS